MQIKNSLEAKMVKFSKTQLEAKLVTEKDPDMITAINNILARRSGTAPKVDPTAKEIPVKEAPKAKTKTAKDITETMVDDLMGDEDKAAKNAEKDAKAKADKEAKDAKAKADKEAKDKAKAEKEALKKIPFVPVIDSENVKVKESIANLQTKLGKDLEDLRSDLQMQGIDVAWISHLQKGDSVEFQAAKNSPLSGQTLKGIVTGISDTDKAGRKYCKIKAENGTTFQKAQLAVTRLALVEKEVKVSKSKSKDQKDGDKEIAETTTK